MDATMTRAETAGTLIAELARLNAMAGPLYSVACTAWDAWDQARREGWRLGDESARTWAEHDAKQRRLEVSWGRTDRLQRASDEATDAYLTIHNQARAIKEILAAD